MTRVRLIAFAGIGVLAALQWGTLLAGPPTLRLFGVVAVATLLGLALDRLRTAPAGPRRAAVVIGLVLAGGVAALLVLGTPAASAAAVGLGPARRGDRRRPHRPRRRVRLPVHRAGRVGAAAARRRDRAADDLRIGVLLPPGPRRGPGPGRGPRPDGRRVRDPRRRAAGRGAAALGDRAAAARGRLALGRARPALPALGAVAGFGVVAIPVASGLAAEDPPIDYRTWTLPGTERGRLVRLGARLRSDRLAANRRAPVPGPGGAAVFWRADVLDEFYGDGWRRSGTGGPAAPGEARPGFPKPDDPRSMRTARLSVLDLESPLLISPGTPVAARGIGNFDRDADGTTHLDRPLEAGASYTVTAWAPDPRPPQLRAASQRYRHAARPLHRARAAGSGRTSNRSALRPTSPSRSGERAAGGPPPRRALDATAYAQVARLAERLTAGERDAYDATVAINDHLRTTYVYDERPPRAPAAAARVPVPGPARLLPAVLGRDGADAEDGRDPGPRRLRVRARRRRCAAAAASR